MTQPDELVRILFVGDVVGTLGRKTLAALLPSLQAEHEADFTVVNGENAAGGVGITPKVADEIFALGVDVITLGNHAFRQREIYPYLDGDDPIIRPANYLASQPGRGSTVVEKNGVKLGVLNVSGNLFLDAAHPMFPAAERAVSRLHADTDLILVDVHAEATSEKVALGWYLDGRVTCVVGTHTHVPTADARVLPEGTAYLTDAGMTGPRGGVIGVKREQAIERMVSGLPVRFSTSDQDPWLMGALITADQQTGKATAIRQLLVAADLP